MNRPFNSSRMYPAISIVTYQVQECNIKTRRKNFHKGEAILETKPTLTRDIELITDILLSLLMTYTPRRFCKYKTYKSIVVRRCVFLRTFKHSKKSGFVFSSKWENRHYGTKFVHKSSSTFHFLIEFYYRLVAKEFSDFSRFK